MAFLPIGTFPLAGVMSQKLIAFSVSKYKKKPFLGGYIILFKNLIIYFSPILHIFLLVSHIVALNHLYGYTSEILLDSTTTDKANSADEIFLIAVHSAFSFPFLFIVDGFIIRYMYKQIKEGEKEKFDIIVEGFSISNIVYLVYFLPYMIIAFVDNPYQAIFVYAILLIFVLAFVLIIFLLMLGMAALCTRFLKFHVRFSKNNSNDDKKFVVLILAFMGISIPGCYYLVCLVLLFTIGGFNNFRDLQNLLWLVLGALIAAVAGHIFKKAEANGQNNQDPNGQNNQDPNGQNNQDPI